MASKANIVIDQGTDFSTEIQVTDNAGNPLNLTGFSAYGQIRKWYTSINCVSFGTTCSNGQIVLSLPAASSSAMYPGKYVYDVIMVDSSNNTTRVVEGDVRITPQVTTVANNVIEQFSNTENIDIEV